MANTSFAPVDVVQHAVVEQRLRLAGILRADARVQVDAPFGLQVLDVVAVDLRQRRVALVVDVAAVGDPRVLRERGELLLRECRRRLDRLRAQRSERVRAPTDDTRAAVTARQARCAVNPSNRFDARERPALEVSFRAWRYAFPAPS